LKEANFDGRGYVLGDCDPELIEFARQCPYGLGDTAGTGLNTTLVINVETN
jgi:hypothetical protein